MSSVLAIFGISGVGKTFMASRFASTHGAYHCQASQLIRQTRGTSVDLRLDSVLDNQRLLIHAFAELRKTETKNILFDGHSVIDGSSGPVVIPTNVISEIGPTGLLFIRDDPAKIVDKRDHDKERIRPIRTLKEIENHQEHALGVCKEYSQELGLSLSVIDAGDWEKFEATAIKILKL